MKTYLGWDCAYKSLAWSHLSVNTNIFTIINAAADALAELLLLDNTTLRNRAHVRASITVDGAGNEILPALVRSLRILNIMLGSFVQFHDLGAVDILGGLKVAETSEIGRTRYLYDFLQGSNVRADQLVNTKPVIEHQPPRLGFKNAAKTNTKSTVVSHQLAFYYIEHEPSFIDPKLKNNIVLRDDLTYERFYAEARTRYKNDKDAKYHARKAHSKANFLHLIETFGHGHITMNIPAGMLDDAADACIQVFAFILANGEFTKNP